MPTPSGAFLLPTARAPVTLDTVGATRPGSPFRFTVQSRTGAPLATAEVAPPDLAAARARWRQRTGAAVLSVVAFTLLLLRRRARRTPARRSKTARGIRRDGRHRRRAHASRVAFWLASLAIDDRPSLLGPINLLLTALVAAAAGVAGCRPDRAPAADGSAGAAADVVPIRGSANVRCLPRGRRARRSRPLAVRAPAANGRSADQRRPPALLAPSARRHTARLSRSDSCCCMPPPSGPRPRSSACPPCSGVCRGGCWPWLATVAWVGGALLGVAAISTSSAATPAMPLLLALAARLAARPRFRGFGFARGTCRRRCGWARSSSPCSSPAVAMYPSLLAFATDAKEQLIATEYGPQAVSLRDDLQERVGAPATRSTRCRRSPSSSRRAPTPRHRPRIAVSSCGRRPISEHSD